MPHDADRLISAIALTKPGWGACRDWRRQMPRSSPAGTRRRKRWASACAFPCGRSTQSAGSATGRNGAPDARRYGLNPAGTRRLPGSTRSKTSASCGPPAISSGSSIRLPTEARNRTTRVLPNADNSCATVLKRRYGLNSAGTMRLPGSTGSKTSASCGPLAISSGSLIRLPMEQETGRLAYYIPNPVTSHRLPRMIAPTLAVCYLGLV
jgi:hypothetical protein